MALEKKYIATEATHERIADALELLDERMDKIGICSIPYGARRNNTAYQVGDIAYSYNLPPYLRLECVKAGTTAATEPDFSAITAGGGIVSDGTILWIVDDVRDGTPVGQVRASMFVPAGYVKLEGGTVNRENYPRLVALADAYSLWTSDTANNPGLFGEGDGTTTMVLPNWTGRMAQFAATAGGAVEAGLPNILGQIDAFNIASRLDSSQMTYGSFSGVTDNFSINSTYNAAHRLLNFLSMNASKSNSIYGNSTTVQPPAINVFAIMRY